ncbi:MAG TPA: glycosyltransferase family 4 protein [Roseiflexaceae bacterium]|nr:glycosyltransferase family 4 protein [Roseiflexaceae bacterium]
MRVLMLSWEYPPHIVGGLGRHVMHLASALATEGVAVHVLTPMLRHGARREVTPEGVHIHRVEAPHMQDDGFVSFVFQTNTALERAARELQREGGDFTLIHAHDWLVANAGVALKHAWRRPLVGTIHATERGRMQGYVGNGHSEQINSTEWWLTYESWRLIACSRFMAGQVQEYFGAPADKIDVVPNGVPISPSPFAGEEERRVYRRQFVADGQALVFCVGRLVYEKGQHVLLEAWPQVLSAAPQARLLVAGTGAQLDALKQRARELGVAQQVIFTGFVADEDRDRLYHVADVAVFPSIYEPFGIVALEAMAACCPVVVSETGGLMEVVHQQETGLVVRPGDPGALAEGILQTLQHPEQARARATAALRDVRERYSWARVAALTASVYRRTYAAWRQNPWGAALVQQH